MNTGDFLNYPSTKFALPGVAKLRSEGKFVNSNENWGALRIASLIKMFFNDPHPDGTLRVESSPGFNEVHCTLTESERKV